MDTLALGYDLPTAGQSRDFHPLERALAGRTVKTGAVASDSSCFAFSCGILISAQKGFDILFEGGDGGDAVVVHQHLQHVGGDEGGQGGTRTDVLNAQMQQRRQTRPGNISLTKPAQNALLP